MCKVFPTSLKGPTLSWFTRLPPGSMDSFTTLSSRFVIQFATSRPHQLTSITLVNIRQEKKEPLRTFMERFRKMTLSIRDLDPAVAMHHLTTTLRLEPFVNSIYGVASHQILSFLDAYFGYNLIPMYPPDEGKITFITESANFRYRVMPVGLKNAGATYQRLMYKIFHQQIEKCLEVYVDDMVVKSDSMDDHIKDLRQVFDKAIIDMRRPRNVKEVQRLAGRIASLARFLPCMADKSRPIMSLLKKARKFQWTEECELSFQEFKAMLAAPPLLSKQNPQSDLIVYIVVSKKAISAALVQERKEQVLVYFVSRVLQEAETRYQQLSFGTGGLPFTPLLSKP
uniref:Transposon Ty3-I Gag-Pol polyprotein n=1 Tax=Cajanus cajan TaxID=3821 RepID=A0A151TW32_CAJCA|nr:Transposon Ty3-I Gag-Pol polyprotein [Cajanus cajan]